MEHDTTVAVGSEIRKNASLFPTVALLILNENVSTGCRSSVGPEYLDTQGATFEILDDKIHIVELLAFPESRMVARSGLTAFG
jgi:hypothetical protein